MTPRSLPLWLALVFALLCGALVAIQSRINGELGARLGDGFTAAAISFGSGLIILTVGLAVAPAGRRGLARVREALRGRGLRWWYVCVGAAGSFLVLS
ncbi:MAG: DMT family transporter, partial [Leifsonia sp.]|nr:DMT family transporter [Leifsonia sp.]